MLNRKIGIVASLATGVSCLLLGAMVLLNATEIVSRYLFGGSLVWVQEITLFFVVWATYLGLIAATYDEKEIRINLLTSFLPHKIKLFVSFVEKFAILIVISIALYQSVNLMIGQWPRSTPILGISTGWFTLPLCISFLFMLVIRSIKFNSSPPQSPPQSPRQSPPQSPLP